MNKLFFSVLAITTLFGSCVKDDDNKNNGGSNNDDLITPEMANMAVSSTKSFTGALTVLPCVDNTSTYYGNFNTEGSLTAFHANYIIANGLVTRTPTLVRLPAGDYNFLYWGVPLNSQADSTYDRVAINEPPLRLGTDLDLLSYSLRKNNLDTTYMPVYDFVFAVQPIRVGTDKMQATLQRVVAGLKVTLKNHDGLTMNPSIASADIHIGSIADNLNYYTAKPSDFTKTVTFPLTMSSDSLSMSPNSTVMVFPSGNAPLLSIILQLKNGQKKIYSKPLSAPLTAGNRLSLSITLGELLIEEGSSDDFEVENWTETSETINFSD